MTAMTLYVPRSIKRVRRTATEMRDIESAIEATLAADYPMTVRQLFYALTVQGVIPKTEAAYKGTVVRLLAQMRRAGQNPYSWISDNTRWMRKPSTYSGLGHLLTETAKFYRRDLWDDASVYVEIWCEKDALAGVILEETNQFDVPLMVSRGFSSDTYLHSSAEAIRHRGKPAFIFQFGDHDPSGIWISRKIEEGLRHHAPHAEIYFQRMAVKPNQIEEWSLPSRPTKVEGNRHAKDFVGDSVELDAIPAAQLRALVRSCIEPHLDPARLAVLEAAEESEREILTHIAEQFESR